MIYLFVVPLALFAFFAPFKTVAPTLLLLFLMTAVVRATANAVTNARPTLGEAFRAVAWSFMLVGLGALFIISFSIGGGSLRTGPMSVAVFFAGTFCANVLGFSLGLGTTFGHSALVALISAAVTSALLAAFNLIT